MCSIAQANGAVACRKGLTVAIVPCLEGAFNPKFYKVAVAHCSDSDEFDYSRGVIIAENRLCCDNFITLQNPFPGSPPQRAAEYFASMLV